MRGIRVSFHGTESWLFEESWTLNVFATTVVVYGLFQFNDGPKLEKVEGHLVRWTKGVKAFDGLSRFLI